MFLQISKLSHDKIGPNIKTFLQSFSLVTFKNSDEVIRFTVFV